MHKGSDANESQKLNITRFGFLNVDIFFNDDDDDDDDDDDFLSCKIKINPTLDWSIWLTINIDNN